MSMREKLVGTWALVTYTEFPVDGSAPVQPFGDKPEGFIIYTADGYMSAQLSMPRRALFSSGDWFEGTDAEYRDQGMTYISYSGPFHIDEHSGELTHTIAVSLFPNWVGQVQPRTVKLAGDILVLGNTSQYLSRGRAVNAEIRWRRVVRHNA